MKHHHEQINYVSRAALKLESAAEVLGLDFRGKTVLDVGSSTGGFTDYALQHGAKKVIAVEVGSNQLHTKLRQDKQVELHEKTDIRNFKSSESTDYILIDVSFISLKEILPALKKFCRPDTQIVAMVKPQFEVDDSMKNKGVIKNEKMRRQVLRNFENWAKQNFLILAKADSKVAGRQGNVERFYLLTR